MFNVIIIITGLVFAWIGYRKSWYPSWALLFNMLISVYISVMISPQIIEKVPTVREQLGDFSYAAGILMIALSIFCVMQLLTFKFFTAVYLVSLPKILNSTGAAVLGFLSGLVIAGFAAFLITITPLSDSAIAKLIISSGQTGSHPNNVMLVSCDFVHKLSLQPDPTGVADQMESIYTCWRKPAANTVGEQ